MTICLETVYTVVYIQGVMETRKGKEGTMETKTANTVIAQVFHVKDVDGLSGRSLLGEIAWGEAAIGFESNHELVAEVAVETSYQGTFKILTKGVNDVLNEAFEKTNNINSSWTLNEGVQCVGALGGHGPRSTSVGDVIVVSGVPYVCAPIGWVEVTSPAQRLVRGGL
jgi:hypothetical protein